MGVLWVVKDGLARVGEREGGREVGGRFNRSACILEEEGRKETGAYWPPRMMTAPAASTSGQPEVHLTLVLGVPQTVLLGQPEAVEYCRKSSNRSRRS